MIPSLILKNRSIAQKTVAMVVLGMMCLSVVLLVSEGITLNRYAEAVAADREASSMRTAWTVLRSYGEPFEIKDGKLYAGTQALTGFFEIVDRITKLAGGTATIFQGDTRISTNVLKPDGTRAIGTHLKAGPVYDQVLKSGQPFRGEAEILGELYITAYDPIRDARGKVIGILYVGLPKADVLAPIVFMRQANLLLSSAVTIAVVLVCMYLTRRMFEPLGALRASADRLSGGDFDADVPYGNRGDELGGLARALITLRESNREKMKFESIAAEQRRAREIEQLAAADARASALEAQLAAAVELESERAMAKLRMQSSKLEAVGTLAAGIAHDFNNILASIVACAELAEDDLLDGSEAKENIAMILSGSFRARDLVARMLDFARERPVSRLPVDVVLQVREAIALLRASLRPSVELAFQSGMQEEGTTIMADATQIVQMVMNLCINAAHAMDNHGVIGIRVDPAGAIKDAPPELIDGICITVADTGSGMTPEVLERMFDPFFTTKAPGEGSGLGLSVVYGLVRGFGGVIQVRSSAVFQNSGTQFHVFLPITRQLDVDRAAPGLCVSA